MLILFINTVKEWVDLIFYIEIIYGIRKRPFFKLFFLQLFSTKYLHLKFLHILSFIYTKHHILHYIITNTTIINRDSTEIVGKFSQNCTKKIYI